jgi:hypothetical protein
VEADVTLSRKRADRAVLWLISAAIGAGCASRQANPPGQEQPLKNWALSRCLAKANPNEHGGDDAARSAAAYLEMSQVGVEVYEKLDGLVDTFLKRTYTGSVKSDYNTMKCIDLYQSKDLQAFVGDVALRHR